MVRHGHIKLSPCCMLYKFFIAKLIAKNFSQFISSIKPLYVFKYDFKFSKIKYHAFSPGNISDFCSKNKRLNK